MIERLPGWIVDEVDSVRAEVATWRDSTAAQRWRMAVACSRDALWATKASGRAEQVLARVDPLPNSSCIALARLRRAVGWGDGNP